MFSKLVLFTWFIFAVNTIKMSTCFCSDCFYNLSFNLFAFLNIIFNVTGTIHLFSLCPTKLKKESSPLQRFDTHRKIFLKESWGVLRVLVRNAGLSVGCFSSMPCLPHNFFSSPHVQFPHQHFPAKMGGQIMRQWCLRIWFMVFQAQSEFWKDNLK